MSKSKTNLGDFSVALCQLNAQKINGIKIKLRILQGLGLVKASVTERWP